MSKVLSVRVERLERVVDDELARRQKSEKYTHNMLEDLRIQMKAGFEQDNLTDREMEDRLAHQVKGQDKRLKRIELALATGLGCLIVIGWLVNHAADNILRLLGAH